MFDRNVFFTKASLEKERSPLALITGIVRNSRRAMSVLGITVWTFLLLNTFSNSTADVLLIFSFCTNSLNCTASSTKSSSKLLWYFYCRLDTAERTSWGEIEWNLFKNPKFSHTSLYDWYLGSSSDTSRSITQIYTDVQKRLRPDSSHSGSDDSSACLFLFLFRWVSALYSSDTVGDMFFAAVSKLSNWSRRPTTYSRNDRTRSTALHKSNSTACGAVLMPWKRWRMAFHVLHINAISNLFIFLCSTLASSLVLNFWCSSSAMLSNDCWIPT